MTHRWLEWVERFDRGLARLEAGLIVALIGSMFALALTQLGLRKGFDLGFEWADVTVRQLVMCTGFIGGALATSRGQHIAIDAVGRLLPPRAAAALAAIAAGLALAITAWLTAVAVGYVAEEHGAALSQVFGGEWPEQAPFEVVAPLGLGAACLHFAVAVIRQTASALAPRKS